MPTCGSERVVIIYHSPVSFNVTAADEDQERLAITIGEREAGEAVIRYESATAIVDARVDLGDLPLVAIALERFHHEFSAELLAYVLNRGAMAQESDGSIIYDLGHQSHALPLPTNQEVGLGYPNSW